MKIFISLIIYLNLVSISLATDNASDNFTIPHTFNSGETISSNAMNENFSSIVEQINSLKINVYSNNEILGQFFGFKESNILLKNSKGFLISMTMSGEITDYNNMYDTVNSSGFIQKYYLTSDCSGNTLGRFSKLLPNQIFINWIGGGNVELWYTGEKKGSETISATAYITTGWSCTSDSQNVDDLIEIFPNDPQITGVTSATFNLKNLEIR